MYNTVKMIIILTVKDCKNATVNWLTEPFLTIYGKYTVNNCDRSNGKFHVILL